MKYLVTIDSGVSVKLNGVYGVIASPFRRFAALVWPRLKREAGFNLNQRNHSVSRPWS